MKISYALLIVFVAASAVSSLASLGQAISRRMHEAAGVMVTVDRTSGQANR